MVCEHLAALEKALLDRGAPVTCRGRPWTENCREWVYFGVILDAGAIRARFSLPPWVEVHENRDPRSGLEKGLVCTRCHDGVMGMVSGPYETFP